MRHGKQMSNQNGKNETEVYEEYNNEDKSETIEMIRNFINSFKKEDKEVQDIRPKKERIKYIEKNEICSTKILYKCKLCRVTKKTKKHMLKHLQSHDEAPKSCRKCKQSFNGDASFQWHLKYFCTTKFERRWKYKCELCPRRFVSVRTLQSHLEGHKRNNCSYCEKVLTRRVDLMRHLLDVHSVKLQQETHKCNHCDKSYIKKYSLYYHLQQHFPDQFVCLECGVVTPTIEDSDDHKKQHDREKRFTCNECGDKFSRRQQYLYHIKKHNRYRCVTCNENFASRLKVIKHKQNGHHVEGLNARFLCSMCPLAFHRESRLVLHMRKHTDTRSVGCQYCKKSFSSPYAYYKHCITLNHEKCSPEMNDLICGECGKRFFKRYDLKQHMYRAHNFTKEPLVCQYCNYKTVHKSNWDRHVALHFREKNQFTCEYCGKSCDSLARLNDHIAYNHIQTKQFKCDKCDKSFKRNSELVRHQESHSDIRPHVCSLCSRAYKRLNHLKRHQKQSHQIVNTPRRIESVVEEEKLVNSPKIVIVQQQILPPTLMNIPVVDMNLKNEDLDCYLPFESEDLNGMCNELDICYNNIEEFNYGG